MIQSKRRLLGQPFVDTENGLFSLAEVSEERIHRLVQRSVELFEDRADHSRPLASTIVGVLFAKTSTRTRTAFSAAALRLGGQILTFGPDELQLATGESLEDTARVFGRMLDILVIRTAGPVEQMRRISRYGRLPVINAMASEEHPSQGICDLATVKLYFGRVETVKILYMGEGNNTAASLLNGIAHYQGCELTLMTPPSYGIHEDVFSAAQKRAMANGTRIRQVHSLEQLPGDVDVVYATRWQTTGTTKHGTAWREEFRSFYVDESLMGRWPNAVFMHDLPAHRGDEVSTAVLEGTQTLAWTQAEMKLASAMAILESLVLDK